MKIMKRIMSIILIAALLFGMVPWTAIQVSAAEDAGLQPVISIAENEPELPQQGSSGTDGVSRIQWVQMLVTTFDMFVEEDNYPDNYYSDISAEDEFYRDLMVAIEFGVISLEPGLEFRPHDPATREFAVSTLNYCMGFILEESQTYLTYPMRFPTRPISSPTNTFRFTLVWVVGKTLLSTIL